MRLLEILRISPTIKTLEITALAGIAALAGSLGYAQSVDFTDLTIESVNIVDVLNNRVITDQTVVIDDSRIVSIASAGDSATRSGSNSINATGLYLMPGLVDAHVHLQEPDLALYLANGITTVIEMNGSLEKLEIRSRVESGELSGPRIYMTSPLLAGVAQNFSFELVENPQQARQAVRRSRELGYDFIKVYDGLALDTYEALLQSANEFDMPLLGHIPASISLNRVVNDNFKSIEHVEQIARSTVGHDFDTARVPAVVAQLSVGSSAVTPTLAAMEILNSRRTAWFDTLFDREEMRYTPNSVADWWQSMRAGVSVRGNLRQGGPGGSSAAMEFYRILTRELHDHGVLILAGTDTPNPLLVPGFSLHHEFAALSRAGISNAAILRMATSNAAQHLNAQAEFGRIESGLLAELILLRENPLDNLAALQTIQALILGDQYFDRDALDELLDR